MKYSDFTTAREIGTKVIAWFKPKFYINNTKNKPGYENEMNLSSKVNMWLRSVVGIKPFWKEVYGRRFPAYSESVREKCFGECLELFKEFIDTPQSVLDLQVFRACYKELGKIPEYVDNYNDYSEEAEPDEMELASDELLKNDGVYGYVEERLRIKIRKMINEAVKNYLK